MKRLVTHPSKCTGCRSCMLVCSFIHTDACSYPGSRIKIISDEGRGIHTPTLCQFCEDPPCASACPVEALSKNPKTNAIHVDESLCNGCQACVDACPFGAPAIDYWNLAMPQVRKCSFCWARQRSEIDEAEVDGKQLLGPALERHKESFHTPACAKACPTDAIQFGDRDELLAEAKRRIAAEPDRYVDQVYGETEAGGTGWLYLARVPFEQLGFPTTFQDLDRHQKADDLGSSRRSRPALASFRKGLGALAAGMCWFFQRRDDVRGSEARGRS